MMQLVKISDLIRVGRDFDGGYVISELLMKQSSVLISFGVNDDWSFEKDFVKKSGLKCYCYDFSINRTIFFKRAIQQIRFFFGDIVKRKRINWSRIQDAGHQLYLFCDFNLFFQGNKFYSYGVDKISHGEFKSLDEILNNQFIGKSNIFLKVDIEGYEFQILDDIMRNCNRFHAFAIEVHGIHERGDRFEYFLNEIQERYYIYHIHANNYSSLELRRGYPNVIEISCVRKDLILAPEYYADMSHLPLEGVDFPNDLLAPDFKWHS